MIIITKKRLITMVLAVMLFAALTATTAYASGIIVEIDGVQVDFDGQDPANVDGRTLVPVRGVFEALGFEMSWDANSQQITLTGDNVIALTIGSSNFTTDGQSHMLDAPAQIIGGRTMLPLRAVLESVGYGIGWDDARSAVLITTNPIGVSAATSNYTVRVTIPNQNDPTTAFPRRLSNLSDFSEGIAWVDSNNGTTAINTAGEILFTTATGTGQRWDYKSQFQDGTAFLIATRTVGMEPITTEVAIVDRDGNYLFRRAGEGFNILAYGNGLFVVAELVSGFAAHYWQVGAIGSTGNIVVPMRPYPNTSTNLSWVERELIEYLGSGIFQLFAPDVERHKDGHTHIFNLHTNEIILSQYDLIPGQSWDYWWNIRLLSNFEAGYAIATIEVEFGAWRGVEQGIYRIDLNGQPIEQLGERALHRNVVALSADGLFAADRAFFNRLGELVVEIPSIQGIPPSAAHPMINGYAIVEYRGADGNNFFTVMNVGGQIMFDPIPIDRNTMYRCNNGNYIIVIEPGRLSIYTTHGHLVAEITGGVVQVPGIHGVRQPYLLSEGFVRFSHFFVNIYDGRIITEATGQ